jgi:hypothetical protein
MQWTCDARVTLEEIDAIRLRRGTDQLARFSPLLPLLLLGIALAFFFFAWKLLDANGVTLANLFTRPIYLNGVDGKQSSVFLLLPLAAIFLYLGGWMGHILFHWARRGGVSPLSVSDSHVQFSGTAHPRNQISHFERQHWQIIGAFAMQLHDGRQFRFPTAAVIGAPVRDIDPEMAKQNRDFVNAQIFLAVAAAIGAIAIMVFFYAV